MSGISLEKGGRVNLTKTSPGLTKIRVGLGWNTNKYDTGADYDLDVSAFLCSTNSGSPKMLSDAHLVYYGNKTSPDKAIQHTGDNRTGEGDGDDETILVDLSKIEAGVDEISFTITIYEADVRKQNFGQVSNSYAKLYDDVTGAVIATYSLEDDFSVETAVQVGSLYKKDGEWLFKAVGAGFKKGLGDFILVYGGNLA